LSHFYLYMKTIGLPSQAWDKDRKSGDEKGGAFCVQAATECADQTGMLKATLLGPVLDEVARQLQLLPPSSASSSSSGGGGSAFPGRLQLQQSPPPPPPDTAAAAAAGAGAVVVAAAPLAAAAVPLDLADEFASLDVNGDGYITAAELRQQIVSSSQPSTAAAAAAAAQGTEEEVYQMCLPLRRICLSVSYAISSSVIWTAAARVCGHCLLINRASSDS
jgi:hypothetical protein